MVFFFDFNLEICFIDDSWDNFWDNFEVNFFNNFGDTFKEKLSDNFVNTYIVHVPIFSRNLTTYPKKDRFDVDSQHEHRERPNNLKIALIHERELTLNHSGPTIYDIELVHYLQSKPEFLYYLKVIYTVKIGT